MNKQDTETQPGKARDWLIQNVSKDELKCFEKVGVVSTYTLIPGYGLKCPEGEQVVNITTKSEWHDKFIVDSFVESFWDAYCKGGGGGYS